MMYDKCFDVSFKFAIELLQVGKRSEHTRTLRMYAPITCSSANRVNFYQPDGEIRQEACAKKY